MLLPSLLLMKSILPSFLRWASGASIVVVLSWSQIAQAQDIVGPTEKIYSAVRNSTSAPQEIVVRNSGSTPLQISRVTLTGANSSAFNLVTPPSMPQTVNAGATVAYQVVFQPATSVGALSASLQITSTEPHPGVLEVALYGLSAKGKQGANEPTLNDVVKTLGYTINVGGTELILGTGIAPIGDEVIAPRMVKAGEGPVYITPVARYSPDDLLDFGYYIKDGDKPVRTKVGTVALRQEQTLNPALVPGSGTTFDPGSAVFGFYTGPAPHYAPFYTYSEDALNVSPAPLPHAVRIYPLKDRGGNPLRDCYLVCVEPAKNGDYQDYVFVVRNLKPYQ